MRVTRNENEEKLRQLLEQMPQIEADCEEAKKNMNEFKVSFTSDLHSLA